MNPSSRRVNSITTLIFVYAPAPETDIPFELLARLAVESDEQAANEMIAGAESQLQLERAAAICKLDGRKHG